MSSTREQTTAAATSDKSSLNNLSVSMQFKQSKRMESRRVNLKLSAIDIKRGSANNLLEAKSDPPSSSPLILIKPMNRLNKPGLKKQPSILQRRLARRDSQQNFL